jgi:glycerophosphoryl diester phosphodiesterase
MILISHRGNTTGIYTSRENEPEYIDYAIKEGFDVEVDVWYKDNTLLLGHDKPEYGVDFRWFRDRITTLWIHCKNIEAVEFFSQHAYDYNYFWHQEDTLTLTSHKHIWAYPGKQPIKNSIAVMPELYKDNTSNCIGICSDYIKNYKYENISRI